VMQQVERPLLTGALARSGGVRAAAAATLGIDRGTLARRLRALGLDET
jgi:Fis family transcriptional regulator, factor for inversion stimulation protein